MIPCTDCNKIIKVEETKRSEVKVDVKTTDNAAPATPAEENTKKSLIKSFLP